MRLAVIAAALAFAGSAAHAFQEQQVGAGAAGAAPQQQVVPVPGADLGAGATVTAPMAPPAAQGTEIRIPGLGKLGVIPKMDFGLELLYGATDNKRKGEEPTEKEDQLMIRGAIKHRF